MSFSRSVRFQRDQDNTRQNYRNQPETATEHYIQWAKDQFPTRLKRFCDKAMVLYEKNQPIKEDESEEDYINRCDEVYQNLLRKHGTCNDSVENCLYNLTNGTKQYIHRKCEENRRRDYTFHFPFGEPQEEQPKLEAHFTRNDFPTLKILQKEKPTNQSKNNNSDSTQDEQQDVNLNQLSVKQQDDDKELVEKQKKPVLLMPQRKAIVNKPLMESKTNDENVAIKKPKFKIIKEKNAEERDLDDLCAFINSKEKFLVQTKK